ncbi:MAG TPA: SpaA isopeptide-forming pilin-related protein [Egibacteraceae bacterium]|nr:SpaA isopeptide-forming pilin-related protein [Egibacteraceae bacterium]
MVFQSRRVVRSRIVGLAALAAVLMGALPAAASVAPPEDANGSPAVALQQERLRVPDHAHPEWPGEGARQGGARTMWAWSEGRRGYFLGGLGALHGYATVSSVDLDSGEEVARATLSPAALGTGANMAGHAHIATVDEQNGRLLVAYEVPPASRLVEETSDTQGGLGRQGDRLVPVGTYPEGQCTHLEGGAPGSAKDEAHKLCMRYLDKEPGAVAVPKEPEPELILPSGVGLEQCLSHHTECFGGITVLDGETLDPLRTIQYQPVRVDGGAVVPFLRALSFEPASQAGDDTVPAKVYAIVEEATGFVGDPRMTRTHVSNVVYVVQFDPETGQQDWALRIDQCRGARESRSDGTNLSELRNLPHAATVYRTTRGEQPVMVVGCHSGGTQVGTVVRVPLTTASVPQPPAAAPGTGAVEDVDLEAGPAALGGLAPQTSQAQSYAGPDKVWEMLADPASDRVLMKVVDGNPQAEVWWVFDGGEGRFVGTIGIGLYSKDQTVSALDTERGRLYVRAPTTPLAGGALYVADVRRTPLSQALVFPALELPSGGGQMTVDTGGQERPTRLLAKAGDVYQVIVDRLPVSVDLPVDDFAGRTLDLAEVEGVTASTFDAVARGYGMRALFVGGLEAATRAGPADPAGQAFGAQDVALGTGPFQPGGPGHGLTRDGTLPLTSPCTAGNREVVLGMVGPESPAVVDSSGGRAAAEPVIVDTGLRADSEAPASRCLPIEWNAVWRAALFNNAPVAEPTTRWAFGNGEASCVSTNEDAQGAFGDAVTGGFAASVECQDEQVSGWSYARAMTLEGGVAVGEASSRFTVYRDPGRGVVSRVESIARAVNVPGAFSIDVVRSVAESWANGRRQPVDAKDRPADYDPNCDLERSAGTCFVRQIMGVRSPHYSCTQCSDQRALVEGLNSAFGSQGTVQLRRPEARLAKGAENGFAAAVKKPDAEQFADLVLNNDLLQTVLPGLEIVRYAQPNRLYGGGQRGRQIYQFAGVEVSSSYGISCLLTYDAETNTCDVAKEPPGSLTITLANGKGEPLAGGAFEVRADSDGDGILGLADALLPDGACVTADDGVGTCVFDDVAPGTYHVTQVAAPPGYTKLDEPAAVAVASGEAATLAVTNLTNVAVIEVKASDEAGNPVAGAVFAAYPDPDADGKVAADAQAAGTCTTDADGGCEIRVPSGSYVLVQTSAPGGLEGIAPVAFAVTGGQTAAVGVVNYPPAMPAAPEPAPVAYEPSPAMPEPVVSSGPYAPSEPVGEVAEPEVSLPEAVGGTVVRVIRAPGDAVRLLARDPMQAVAWIASIALFCLAVLAVRRRIAGLRLQ